jgi:formylglycine-generating enzyme required for sulfatase activity
MAWPALRRLVAAVALVVAPLVPGPTAQAQAPVRNPSGVAIIIGNKDYRHRDVPPVDFAHNDADAIARWVIDVRGFDPANVKVIRDAGKADLEAAFGTKESERGLAWRLIEPDGSSDLFVYWSGHGVPGLQSGRGYLLPSDVEPQNAELSAYPLQLLYDNLGKLNTKSVTVVLDACFSGQSDNARLVAAASPLVRSASAQAPGGLTVLAAGTADQVASWDRQARHGLFTDRFLRGVYGAADDPAQNQGAVRDGQVTLAELRGYLNREVTRQARREFGREQTPDVRGGDATVLALFEGGRPPARPSVAVPVAQRPVAPPPAPAASVPQPAVAAPPAAPDTGAVAEAALGLSVDQRRQVQAWLEALGFDPRGVDGQFGPGTRGAIRSFQRSKSLSETGFLSAEVITALAADGPPALARVEEARRARDAAQAALAAARPAAPPAGGSPQARPAVGVFPQAPTERAPGTRFRDCAECPEMVVIPAGTFTMGSPASEAGRSSDEGPQQTIRIPRSIAVGRFEVTFAEWDACVAGGGCGGHRPNDQGWGRGNRPAINVSWQDAQAYVLWLNQRVPGAGYRLLTEAEWEYAARAGTTTAYPWGSSIGSGNANGRDSGSQWSGRQTGPVGSFAANAFGLHDMHGNVWEWTQDCFRGDLNGQPSDGSAFTSGSCGIHVLRGGSWNNSPQGLRSANRDWDAPGNRNIIIGFRVARTPGG